MAIASNTPVPTPEGWVSAINLRIGDLVYTSEGTPQTLRVVQDYIPTSCYRLTFDDGLSLITDGKQVLEVQDPKWRQRYAAWHKSNRLNPKTSKKRMRRPMKTITVKDLAGQPLMSADKKRSTYSVATTKPIQYPSVDLPVPPYVLGVWLFTKGKRHNWIACDQFNIVQRKMRQHGFFITPGKRSRAKMIFEIRPSVKDSFLFMDANIPVSLPFYYVQSSVEQRQQLLEALMDVKRIKMDGNGLIHSYFNRQWKECRKIQAVVESLGIKTNVYEDKKSLGYRVKYRVDPNSDVFPSRYVKKVEKIQPKQCVHLAADSKIVVGEGFIPIC